mmetsp:Transcript_1189/g.2622  ORF Transcript_1189/g.2622 Transcript_1189/m.2622 type:complete len:301 (+) Transcript_1189:53-955(+)
MADPKYTLHATAVEDLFRDPAGMLKRVSKGTKCAFRLHSKITINAIVKKYASLHNLVPDSLRLVYCGGTCDALDTFDSLAMRDGDLLTVHHTLGFLTTTCPESSFTADMMAILRNAEFADCLISAGASGVAVHAHRAVLAKRSPYFRALFSGSFKEKNNQDVNLPEVEEAELREVLAHMYTDAPLPVPADLAACLRLLRAADLLGLERALRQLEIGLAARVSASTASELLVTATAHSLDTLARVCREKLIGDPDALQGVSRKLLAEHPDVLLTLLDDAVAGRRHPRDDSPHVERAVRRRT